MLARDAEFKDLPVQDLREVVDLAAKPECLLGYDTSSAGHLLRTVASLFSHLSETDRAIRTASSSALIESFSLDQKWEQLDKQNGILIEKFGMALKDVMFFKAQPTSSMGLSPLESDKDPLRYLSDQDGFSEIDVAEDESDSVSDDPELGVLKDNQEHSMEADGITKIDPLEFTTDNDSEGGIACTALDNRQSSASNPGGEDVNFFSVDEMNRFADSCEGYDQSDSDDSRVLRIKHDSTMDSEECDEIESDGQIYYEDFFGKTEKHAHNDSIPSTDPQMPLKSALRRAGSEMADMNTPEKRVHFSIDTEDQIPPFTENVDTTNLSGSDSQAGKYADDLSSSELRNLELAKKISEIERQAVSDKPWMLRGEVKASDRGVNSLLEQYIEADFVGKQAPMITDEVTTSLEDAIKERIKNKQFDDPVRKAPPIIASYDPSKAVDMESKSRKSLMEIYEDDYMKKKSSENPEFVYKSSAELELEAQHKEISSLYESIVSALDDLSNLHFTPKPPQGEDFKLTNTSSGALPSLMAEEILPTNVADSITISHKEQFKPVRRALSGADLSSQQKKRIRDRTKKSAGKKRSEKLKLYAAIKAAQPLRKPTKGEVEMEKQQAAKSLYNVSNVKVIGKYNMSKKKGAKNTRKTKAKSRDMTA